MREGNTAYCDKCGKMIQFVLTKNNRWMPVNCEAAAVRPDKEGRWYYRGDRDPVHGRKCAPEEPGAVKALEPHYYTCSALIPKRARESKAQQEQQRSAAEKAKTEKLAADSENREWASRQTSLFRT